MAFDIQKLRQSTFWNKKIDLSARVHDTNKSGDLSPADYELIRERYKSVGASPQQMEMLSKYQLAILDRLGLTDESARRTYAEVKESFIEDLANVSDYNHFFDAIFQILDLNGDGFISLDEWKKHYYCYGIDQAHAPASFNAMDKNKNGKISKEEFVNFHYEYYFTAENKLGSAILYGPLD